METKKLHLFEYHSLLYFLIRSSFVGICLNNLIIISKQDSWISIAVAIILGFIPLTLYYLILNSNPDKNVVEIIKESCGPLLGGIINFLITIFTFVFVSLTLWNLINFISSQYLYKTPHLAISITFAIAILYIINKSINVIGRTAVILFYASAIIYILSFAGLSFQIDINNIKPIFEFGATPIFKGILQYTAYNILPLFLLLIIPKNTINDNKHFLKKGIIFYLISMISLFTVCFFLISIYGIEFSNILQYPAFHLLKRLSLAGFIQRVESILSIQWILDMFMFIVIGLHYIKSSLNITFNLKENKFTNFILIIILIVFTNYLFKNNTVGNIFIVKYFPFWVFTFYLFIPAFIYITKKISQ